MLSVLLSGFVRAQSLLTLTDSERLRPLFVCLTLRPMAAPSRGQPWRPSIPRAPDCQSADCCILPSFAVTRHHSPSPTSSNWDLSVCVICQSVLCAHQLLLIVFVQQSSGELGENSCGTGWKTSGATCCCYAEHLCLLAMAYRYSTHRPRRTQLIAFDQLTRYS